MAKTALTFFKTHKFEVFTLIGIILVGLFFRLYRIGEYLTFLGDEGRDVRIVRDLLQGNLVFIGPQTSIGNMYLGPFYYYLMAPSLWLAGLDPVGPAVMVALLSVITIFFTWFVGRSWFNPMTGLLAALFTAISPVAIIYSHSSWNPNPMPLFALITMWLTYQFWHHRRYSLLPLVGLTFGLCLQFHYLGLLLAPTIGVFYLLTLKSAKDKHLLIKPTLLAIFAFAILQLPLLLFDLKHQGMNFNAFKAFFTDRQTTINFNPGRSDRFLPILYQLFQETIFARQAIYATLGSLATFALVAFNYFRSKDKKPLQFLLTWFFFGFLGLSLYKQHVYAHYFGFVQPAIFLLSAVALANFFFSSIVGRVLSSVAFLFLILINLQNSPLKFAPNRQLQRTKEIVQLIMDKSEGKPFNFGLIAKQNYDESYRYFFENWHANLIKGEDKVVDQLFVVCEDGDSCQPLGNPQWQVAVFGIAAIDEQWQVDNIKIYKLVHPTNGK